MSGAIVISDDLVSFLFVFFGVPLSLAASLCLFVILFAFVFSNIFLFYFVLVWLIGGPLSLAFPLRLDLRELTLLSSSLGGPKKYFS